MDQGKQWDHAAKSREGDRRRVEGREKLFFGSIKLLIYFKTSPEVIGRQFCNSTDLVKYLKLDGENCAAAIIYAYRREAISILKHFSKVYLQILMSSLNVNQIMPQKFE